MWRRSTITIKDTLITITAVGPLYNPITVTHSIISYYSSVNVQTPSALCCRPKSGTCSRSSGVRPERRPRSTRCSAPPSAARHPLALSKTGSDPRKVSRQVHQIVGCVEHCPRLKTRTNHDGKNQSAQKKVPQKNNNVFSSFFLMQENLKKCFRPQNCLTRTTVLIFCIVVPVIFLKHNILMNALMSLRHSLVICLFAFCYGMSGT